MGSCLFPCARRWGIGWQEGRNLLFPQGVGSNIFTETIMHLSVHPLKFCITIVFDFSYDEGDHLCRHSTLTNVWVTTQGSARLYNIKNVWRLVWRVWALILGIRGCNKRLECWRLLTRSNLGRVKKLNYKCHFKPFVWKPYNATH